MRISEYFEKQIDSCADIVDKFFLRDKYYKELFSKKPIFGYFNAKHKESFRLLTGARLIEHTIPKELEKLYALSSFSDELMHKLCLICSKYLFPHIKNKAISHNIPLFELDSRWGMLDVTKYMNDGSKIGLNCDEHYDPGLLSIHYRSTQPGLQLKNEYGKWINPPSDKNVVIIWAGDVATKINPEIKHGVHRVAKTPSKIPRIAMWYEICTKDQEHTELIYSNRKKLEKKEHETGIPISKSR